jgi:hypothetical protein
MKIAIALPDKSQISSVPGTQDGPLQKAAKNFAMLPYEQF